MLEQLLFTHPWKKTKHRRISDFPEFRVANVDGLREKSNTMNEGVFRVLRALGHGQEVSRTSVVRKSGQAHSVISALANDKGKWFDISGERFKLSSLGLAALARELTARRPALAEDELLEHLQVALEKRPSVRRELDQVHATLPSIARRARYLVEQGHHQRGLFFLGDDDLTALAVSMLISAASPDLDEAKLRRITVIDSDERIVKFYESTPLVDAHHFDLREPLPKIWKKRFGCVFTDPPYAPEGFSLFVSRAITALKPDGTLLLQSGHSRRSRERGLKKQRLLGEAGLLIETVLPDFAHYDGAESIGSRSDLHVCAITPQSKPLVERMDETDLYTRRAPVTTNSAASDNST